MKNDSFFFKFPDSFSLSVCLDFSLSVSQMEHSCLPIESRCRRFFSLSLFLSLLDSPISLIIINFLFVCSVLLSLIVDCIYVILTGVH